MQEGIHPLADVDFWVNANSFYNYYFSYLQSGYRIDIDVEVTYGTDIDFYIFDEDNYDLYADGQSCYAEVIQESVGSVSRTFTVTSSGKWHLVFNNDDWLFRRHIEGTITATAPPTTTSTAELMILTVAAIFLIAICILCSKKYEESQKASKQMHGPPSQTAYPSSYVSQQQVHVRTTTNFCPYCGTPKQSSTASFCATCGRAFEGPNVR